MESAEHFMEMYKEAEESFSSGEKSRLRRIEEAREVYNNTYGESIKKKFNTTSMYVSPEGMTVPDLYAEKVLARIPSFTFKTSKEFAVKAKYNVNQKLKELISIHSLDSKMLPLVVAGFRDGIGVGEIIYKDIIDSGWKLSEDGESTEYYKKEVGAGVDINLYDVILNEVLIDPLASPVSVADTARYVIVKVGDFAMEQIEQMKEDHKDEPEWDIDMEQITADSRMSGRAMNTLRDQGMIKPKAVTIHKVFYQNGTVDVIVNKSLIMAKGTINNKHIEEMPLIFYTPYPGGDTPYSRSLWDLIKHAVDIKSGCVNLSADNTAKNITASLITDSVMLAQEADSYDLSGNKVLQIEPGERPVSQRIAQLQWVDMTQGLMFLYGVAKEDLQKITKMSDLSLGSPGFSPRTDGVVDAMSQGEVSATALFLKQTEDTLFQPMGKHILKIIYNFFPKFNFQDEDRELYSIGNIRIQKGTSLEGAQSTQLNLLTSALQQALANPLDWDTKKLTIETFKEAGLPEIEVFLATPERMMLKNLLAMQIPQEQAVAIQKAAVKASENSQANGGE